MYCELLSTDISPEHMYSWIIHNFFRKYNENDVNCDLNIIINLNVMFQMLSFQNSEIVIEKSSLKMEICSGNGIYNNVLF